VSHGPIVIQRSTKEILLLDGQQRLATVTIMLGIIRDVARKLTFSKGKPGDDFARDLHRDLIGKEDVDPPFALMLGELDQEFFWKSAQEDPTIVIDVKLRSHKLIRSAQKVLRAELDKLLAGLDSEITLKKLKHISDCISKGMTVVGINVESENDAYQIFETLNDRGLRLSVPDLLLNLLMRRAETEADKKQVRIKWNYMLEQMGKKDISRFLRHMWLSKYGDLKARGLFNELSDHLKSHSMSSVDFADTCSEDCDAYIALVEQSKEIPKVVAHDIAGLINYLGITSCLPVLLSGKQCLSEGDFVKLIKLVVAIAVRYSLISDLNPNVLESAFYAAAREIRGKFLLKESSAKCLNSAKAILNALNPKDSIVEEKAKEVTLDRAPALWLMTQLANSKQSATKEVAMNEANLEHIYPIGAATTEWPNKVDLDPYVWRIGNLTILGEKLNRDAANKSFTAKCKDFYKKSEIVMTKDILKYNTWTPSEVEKRTEEMAKLIISAFPSP